MYFFYIDESGTRDPEVAGRRKDGTPFTKEHLYPFFTDSKLSNGVQLADLCGYNVYRAFRSGDFRYAYFRRLLPFFYHSKRTDPMKLDGLKVFPDDSELREFARKGWVEFKTEQPTLL
jgi:hypothetical protein